MRRLLKVLLALIVVFGLSQTPFAYRRYQLGRLDAAIRQLNQSRAATDDAGLADYPGVVHVHSFLGGHSEGQFEEIVAGAKSNGLAFVVMTEHPSARFDTRALTLSGVHDGVLFIPGNETAEGERDRLLTFGRRPPQTAHAAQAAGGEPPAGDALKARQNPATNNGLRTTDDGQSSPPLQSQIERARAEGRLVFIAHPETFTRWESAANFDGMEVYNLHADAAAANRLSLFFDGLWSYRAYPHLLWARFHQAPAENLRRWDALTARGGRRVVAVAGNDAHANVGISLRALNGDAVWQLKLDPYERSFRVVRTHALVPRGEPLNEETVSAALAAGHAYVSFDILCDATGFRLTASNGPEQKLMGDEIGLGGGVRLRAETPVLSRVVLVRDGRPVGEKEGTRVEWDVAERGVYRVECYLPQLPDPLSRKPWIISNPVYVR